MDNHCKVQDSSNNLVYTKSYSMISNSNAMYQLRAAMKYARLAFGSKKISQDQFNFLVDSLYPVKLDQLNNY